MLAATTYLLHDVRTTLASGSCVDARPSAALHSLWSKHSHHVDMQLKRERSTPLLPTRTSSRARAPIDYSDRAAEEVCRKRARSSAPAAGCGSQRRSTSSVTVRVKREPGARKSAGASAGSAGGKRAEVDQGECVRWYNSQPPTSADAWAAAEAEAKATVSSLPDGTMAEWKVCDVSLQFVSLASRIRGLASPHGAMCMTAWQLCMHCSHDDTSWWRSEEPFKESTRHSLHGMQVMTSSQVSARFPMNLPSPLVKQLLEHLRLDAFRTSEGHNHNDKCEMVMIVEAGSLEEEYRTDSGNISWHDKDYDCEQKVVFNPKKPPGEEGGLTTVVMLSGGWRGFAIAQVRSLCIPYDLRLLRLHSSHSCRCCCTRVRDRLHFCVAAAQTAVSAEHLSANTHSVLHSIVTDPTAAAIFVQKLQVGDAVVFQLVAPDVPARADAAAKRAALQSTEIHVWLHRARMHDEKLSDPYAFAPGDIAAAAATAEAS